MSKTEIKENKIFEQFKNLKKTNGKLKKITHLYLNDKKYKTIINISEYVNLKILYLQDNLIKKIENLDALENLTQLYLQNNQIETIENLNKLINLEKLYLSHNQIQKLQGLTNMKKLRELYIDKQLLDKDQYFIFDIDSIFAIKESLRVLNISECHIENLDQIKLLYKLEVLIAKNNRLLSLEETAADLSNLFYLCELQLQGNPISKMKMYKEAIIVKTYQLVLFDGKQISEYTRQFLKNLNQERSKFQKKSSKILKKNLSAPSLHEAVSMNQLKSRARCKTSNILNNARTFTSDGSIALSCTVPREEDLSKVEINLINNTNNYNDNAIKELGYLPWKSLTAGTVKKNLLDTKKKI